MSINLGRCGRLEYFLSITIFGIIILATEKTIDQIYDQPNQGLAVFMLILFVLYIIQCLRRLKDIGKSGWYIFLSLVPFANLYIGFILLFQKGNNFKQNIEKDTKVSLNFPSEETTVPDNISHISNTKVINNVLFQKGKQNEEETRTNLFQQALNFLTFDSPTYRSIFDEGQRRVVMVVSLIAPIIVSYLWFYNFDDGYLPSDWFFASPIFYVIFHLICLVYIWIREGSGNVRQGGNALKAIRNFILPLFIGGIIIVTCAFIYDNVYVPQQHEKEMRRKFDQFHKNLVNKNWLMMESIFSYNINGVNRSEFTKGLANNLSDTEFTKWDISDVIKKDRNTLVGKFSYTINDKKGPKRKKKTTIITFSNYHNNTEIEKIEFTDID